MQKLLTLSLITIFSFCCYSVVPDYRFAFSAGAGHNDYGSCILSDAVGNIYVAGVFRDSIDLDPGAGTDYHISQGNTDFFIASYSLSGQYRWGYAAGGTGDDNLTSMILQDTLLIATGSFEYVTDFAPGIATDTLRSKGLEDIFVLKYSINGFYKEVWSTGGISEDIPFAISPAGDYHYILSGTFYSSFDIDPSSATKKITSREGKDIFTGKYRSDNDSCLWVKTHDNGPIEEAAGTAQKKNNHIYTAGAAYGISFIYCYTGTGDSVWKKEMLPVFGGKSNISALAFDEYDNCYITGNFENTVDFNPGPDEYTMTTVSAARDIFICKLDANGEFIWAFKIGASSYDKPEAITISPSGHLLITGTMQGSVDFDPSPSSYILTSPGNDIFACCYAPDKALEWAFHVAGPSTYNSGIDLFASDTTLLLTGYFYYDNDFDPGPDTAMLTTAGLNNNDVFIARYKICNPSVTHLYDSLCGGDSIIVNGIWRKTQGTYTDTLTGRFGCDSIIYRHLTFTDIYNEVFNFNDTLLANDLLSKYQWIDCNSGLALTGETSDFFIPSISGRYAVIYYKNGCIDTSDCIDVNLTGIKTKPVPVGSIVFPNPSGEMIYVDTDDTGQQYIEIIHGDKIILSKTVYGKGLHSISTDGISAGLYLVRIKNSNGIIVTKIIKR